MSDLPIYTPETLIEWADKIDSRLGPIAGRDADAIARLLRATGTYMRLLLDDRNEQDRPTDAFAAERVNEERARIAERVSERRILRLSVGVDPLEEANSIIQDLAHDIETNWSDYEDEE